jgi:two-component system nitrate/nitrite response regulator NarL
MRRVGPVRDIRVLTADAHPIYLEGVARIVRQRPALRLVGESADASATVDQILRLRPDVAVLDAAMPGLDTRRLLNTIERDGLPTRIVLLSADLRPTDAYEAFARGASAYLSKRATCEQIEAAIRRAARGEVTIPREIQTSIVGRIRDRERPERPWLSRRELQVLTLIANGMTARAIAAELIVEASTIRTHTRHICEKLDVHDRAAAVAVAMRHGLLD